MSTTVENNILDVMARLYFNFQKDFRKQKTKDTLNAAKDKALSVKRAAVMNDPFSAIQKQAEVAPPPLIKQSLAAP